MTEPTVTPQTFVETLANLNAVANQQTMQVLQIAALAMQLKNLGELDPTQAVLESKMANLMNTGARAMARQSPITEVK